MNKGLQNFRWIAALLLFALILILTLKLSGLLDTSQTNAFIWLWPFWLILAIAALVLKMRWLALAFVLFAIMLGVWFALDQFGPEAARESVMGMEADGISHADLRIFADTGSIRISRGSEAYAMRNTINSTLETDPVFEHSMAGGNATIYLARAGYGFFDEDIERWSLELSPQISYGLAISSGEAVMDLDMEGLRVESLSLESTSPEILVRFGQYASEANLTLTHAKASLSFPQGYCATVVVSGSMFRIEAPMFAREGDVYQHCESEEAMRLGRITANIDGGDSEISAGLY